MLFFTASDLTTPAPLTRTLTETAALPLFWQFIGLGPTNLTTLQQTLTDLPDRADRPTDNCAFFAFDAPGHITDAALFPELFAAHGRWLTTATATEIARSEQQNRAVLTCPARERNDTQVELANNHRSANPHRYLH
jgi:hypothetical protein